MYNYFNQFQPMQRTEIIRVNGQNSAIGYQMPPNSSVLMLDENLPILYLKTTDGAGYGSVVAYDIAEHKSETPVDLKALEERISRIEEAMANEPNNQQTKRRNSANSAE